VGQAGGGRRAGAVEVRRHRLARICAMPAGAIEGCVEPLGGGGRQGGDPQAGGIVRMHDFRLAPDPPGLCPGRRSLNERGIATATGRRRLARGVGQGAPVVLETASRLEPGGGLAEQDGLTHEATDTIGPAGGGDPVEDLRSSHMPIAADQARGVGPGAPERRQPPAQAQGMFGPRRVPGRT
jgi:hypothetical protein